MGGAGALLLRCVLLLHRHEFVADSTESTGYRMPLGEIAHPVCMNDILVAVRGFGGVARTRELVAAGFPPRRIVSACHAGRILRVRIGWFADPALPAKVHQAPRVGGRVACVSAAELYGLDVLTPHPLHLSVALHDSKFRDRDDMTKRYWPTDHSLTVLHWDDNRLPSRPRVIVPLIEALVQVIVCLTDEEAICVLDSALRVGKITLDDLHCLRSRLPESLRNLLERVRTDTDSILETVFRLRAIGSGFVFQCQVPLPGDRSGDFLFGDRLLVEADGAEHHAGDLNFAAGLVRDAWLARLGYEILHFGYDQIVNDWPSVEATIRLKIRRGEHMRSPRLP